jgi:tryptophan synthase beta chain
MSQEERIKKNVKKLYKIVELMNSVNPTQEGFYGEFGGAFVPEMLYPNVKELQDNYLKIINDEGFKEELNQLLRDYVGRPTPLFFSENLSTKYNAQIYLKREDLNHTGAHKINNTIGQLLLAKRLNKKRIIAETGAGQHGVATATVCALMGMECTIFMGEVDIARQKQNVDRMLLLGAKVVPVLSGSRTLKDATNEAIREWINNPVDTHYIIGSVVGPHPYPDMVAKFQSIISEEIKYQLKEKTGCADPDYVVACIGGGSNAIGAFYHFIENDKTKLIAVEAGGLGIHSGKTAATIAVGSKGIIHGSKTFLMQTADGQIVEPHSISAGLDYPGIGPVHAYLHDTGRATVGSVTDEEAVTAGVELARIDGIIPALESAHALAYLSKMKLNKEDVVVVNLSGRGDKDMLTYQQFIGL